jgi:hypothetical protein
MGESNAESAARHAEIDEEYQRLRRQRPKKRAQTTNKQEKGHALSPFKPIQGKVKFRIGDKHEPILEPIETHTNNVQEVQMDSDHYLYANPDKPPAPQILDLIRHRGIDLNDACRIQLCLKKSSRLPPHFDRVLCRARRIQPSNRRIFTASSP